MKYLRFESTVSDDHFKYDPVYNFSVKVLGDKKVILVDSASHQDFSGFPTIVHAAGNCYNGRTYDVVGDLTISYLQDQLQATHLFPQQLAAALNKTVKER